MSEPANNESKPKRPKCITPIRINVLTLLLVTYGAIVGLFMAMIVNGAEPKEAWDMVSVPFVALVGGTLAVAKDLIQ